MKTVHHVKLKRILRWDRNQGIYRVARLVWQRGKVGDGTGYSCKLSLALATDLFRFRREWRAFFLTIFGIRIHAEKSFGGIHD